MSTLSDPSLPNHVDEYLLLGKEADASDIHLSVSSSPTCRRYGTLLPMWENAPKFTDADTEALVRGFLDEQQLKRLLEQGDVDFAYTNANGRYRTSVVRQRLGYDLAFRIITSNLRTLDELGMPNQLKLLTQYHNGLVLVT
jgi:twitching motility protein PilT